MALRGRKPDDRKQRLKLLLSGEAGVGKTNATFEMPKPYIIDCEEGSLHYGEQIEKVGGRVFEPTDFHDMVKEIRLLMTEDHEYCTLVIDPITTVFDNLLDEGEKRVGTEFGRHYGYANTHFKRLCNLLTSIDMNVVITAHERKEYGDDRKVVGTTFDGYKKLDYIFDLWLQLERDRSTGKRAAYVRKTRLAEFPDMDRFEFTRDALLKRYGADRLEKKTETVALATPDQIERYRYLRSQLSDTEVKTLKHDKIDMDTLADLEAERLAKGIEQIENYKTAATAA